ncbi:MAG: hypothetical protein AABX91_01920 [Nanoarchaeota archaeon]
MSIEQKRIKDIESELEFLLDRGLSAGHMDLTKEHSRRVDSLSKEYKQLTGNYYQRWKVRIEE